MMDPSLRKIYDDFKGKAASFDIQIQGHCTMEKEMRKGAMRFFSYVEMWSAQLHLQEKQKN